MSAQRALDSLIVAVALAACAQPPEPGVEHAAGPPTAGHAVKADGAQGCAELAARFAEVEASTDAAWGALDDADRRARTLERRLDEVPPEREARRVEAELRALEAEAEDARAVAEDGDAAVFELADALVDCEPVGETFNPPPWRDFDGVVALLDPHQGLFFYVEGHEAAAKALYRQVTDAEGPVEARARPVRDQAALRALSTEVSEDTYRARQGYRCHDYGPMDTSTTCRGNCSPEDQVNDDGSVTRVYLNRSPLRLRNKQCVVSENPDDSCIDQAYAWCRVSVFSDRQCRVRTKRGDRVGMLCGQ